MNANTQLLYRYSDGNTYMDNLTLRQAKRFKRLQNGGVIVAMETVRGWGKHTPGPWAIGNDGNGVSGDRKTTLWGNDGTQAAIIIQSGLLSHEDTAEANAHLIAAAPELLSALKQWEIIMSV